MERFELNESDFWRILTYVGDLGTTMEHVVLSIVGVNDRMKIYSEERP